MWLKKVSTSSTFMWFKKVFTSSTFWTAVAAAATVVIAIITGIYTYYAGQQLKQDRRPWIAINVTQNEAPFVSGVAESAPVTFTNDGKKAHVHLMYVLSNSGHFPANVEVYGEIVKHGMYRDLNERAEYLCTLARGDFNNSPRPWTVVPNFPMVYGVHYDDGVSDSDAEHMRAPEIDPLTNKSVDLSNIGCIVYKATTEDGTIYQTPFIAGIQLTSGQLRVGSVLMIGRAK